MSASAYIYSLFFSSSACNLGFNIDLTCMLIYKNKYILAIVGEALEKCFWKDNVFCV